MPLGVTSSLPDISHVDTNIVIKPFKKQKIFVGSTKLRAESQERLPDITRQSLPSVMASSYFKEKRNTTSS